MKKLRAALASVLHALVIAVILFVIFFGLYKLGLVELPEPIARLFGQHSDSYITAADDPEDDMSPVTTTYDKITLTAESVRSILSSVSLPQRFTLAVRYTLFEGEKSRVSQLIIRHDGSCSAAYFLDEGDVSKQVVDNGRSVYVSTFDGDTAKTVEYRRGSITFEQQIGAVFTYASFLEKASDEAYTFELVTDDGNVYMLISFDDVRGSYVQKQSYKLDPDNGIVIEADSYEDDVCVYSCVVTSVTEDLSQTADIPENYLSLEKQLFSQAEQQH